MLFIRLLKKFQQFVWKPIFLNCSKVHFDVAFSVLKMIVAGAKTRTSSVFLPVDKLSILWTLNKEEKMDKQSQHLNPLSIAWCPKK
jgi:hypothetical protein